MFLHLQSSLENKEYEAAANFVDTLAKLHNFMPHKEDITASDSENAQFVRVRDAVARVVREELHTAASKSDVSQVRMWRASSSAASVLASSPRHSLTLRKLLPNFTGLEIRKIIPQAMSV